MILLQSGEAIEPLGAVRREHQDPSKLPLYPEQPLAVMILMEWCWHSCFWTSGGGKCLCWLLTDSRKLIGGFEGKMKNI